MNAKTLAEEHDVWADEPDIHEPLTPEEIERRLALIEELRRFREEWLAARGGIPFRPGWMDLAEARDERTRQLGG